MLAICLGHYILNHICSGGKDGRKKKEKTKQNRGNSSVQRKLLRKRSQTAITQAEFNISKA